MTDYYGIALAGFATGLGVIFAQRLVNWLEKHPLIERFGKRVNSISRGETSLQDLMKQQRELGKKIENAIKRK